MIVLARAVLGHGRHDFRRDIAHVFAGHVSAMAEGPGGRILFSKLLEPSFERKASRGGFRFQRRSSWGACG